MVIRMSFFPAQCESNIAKYILLFPQSLKPFGHVIFNLHRELYLHQDITLMQNVELMLLFHSHAIVEHVMKSNGLSKQIYLLVYTL